MTIVYNVELKLYLMVLKMQGKHEQALQLLDGEWGQCLKMEIEREKMRLELLREQKMSGEQLVCANRLLELE